MQKSTFGARKHIKPFNFAEPEKRVYPIKDKKAKPNAKYPSIGSHVTKVTEKE